jgi:hypothetical protein
MAGSGYSEMRLTTKALLLFNSPVVGGHELQQWCNTPATDVICVPGSSGYCHNGTFTSCGSEKVCDDAQLKSHPGENPCVNGMSLKKGTNKKAIKRRGSSPSPVTGVTWSIGITACKASQASGTMSTALKNDGIPVQVFNAPCGQFTAKLFCVLTKEGFLQSYYAQSNGHTTEGTPVKETDRIKCSYLSTQTEDFGETVRTRCCFPDATPSPSPSAPTPAPAPLQYVSEIVWVLSISECRSSATKGTIVAPVRNDGWPVLVFAGK